ncbi:hypothetical protein [Streptomyces sp. NPDC018610]|uniref:hypothetical protein n=1 Tax=Streptomyces sp. NPDC018610 TaxID=3365049 RepID=UPI0037B005B9
MRSPWVQLRAWSHGERRVKEDKARHEIVRRPESYAAREASHLIKQPVDAELLAGRVLQLLFSWA